MRNKIKQFLSERFDAWRVLAKKIKNKLVVLWKKFWELDRMHMLYVIIAADLLIIAVLVTALLSHRPNGAQSVEASPEASPAAVLTTPAPAVTAPPVPSPTPAPLPTPEPIPTPTPLITPPASDSQDPASPSDVVLVTVQPVSDTDIPDAAS